MELISLNCKKCLENIKSICFISLILLVVCLASIYASADAPKSQDETSNAQQKTRTMIIGLPKNKQETFMRSMAKTEKKFELIRTARQFYKKNEHQKALELLLEALKYSDPSDATDAWNVRGGLADVYEAIGKKDEFLTEIDWLIEKCQNQDTKKQFIDRKNKFLAQYSRAELKSVPKDKSQYIKEGSMLTKDKIDGIGVRLEMGNKTHLLIFITADGSIKRSGSGKMSEEAGELYIGVTKEPLFNQVMLKVDPRLLGYVDREINMPDPKGVPCKTTIYFKSGNLVHSLVINYGLESGYTDDVRAIVIAAHELTKPWYDNFRKIHKQQ